MFDGCSVVLGVIVISVLAVLSALSLILGFIFYIYAKKKLEQAVHYSKASHAGKLKYVTPSARPGVVNTAYTADDLNMQEATSIADTKDAAPGYVVCKEFFQNDREKWLQGLSSEKLVYRLSASDVDFDLKADENSTLYLAYAGVKSSASSHLSGGASKLLKAGDRIHALMLNCSALVSSGKLDESTLQLLLKLVRLLEGDSALFVDVVSSGPHERLVDADDSANCTMIKETDTTAPCEEHQNDISTSESKDSGRDETRTNSEHDVEIMSLSEPSPRKSPFSNRSRGHSRRNAHGGDAKGIANHESASLTESIELTSQHPAYLGTADDEQTEGCLPLPGPEMLRAHDSEDAAVVLEEAPSSISSSTSSSSSSSSSSDDETAANKNCAKLPPAQRLTFTSKQNSNSQIDAYLAL